MSSKQDVIFLVKVHNNWYDTIVFSSQSRKEKVLLAFQQSLMNDINQDLTT